MNLAQPPARYDVADQSQMRRVIQDADTGNRKVGQNVELRDEALIMRSPDGARWQITVSNAGTLTTVAL